MSVDEPDSEPGWNDDSLRETALENAGVGTDAGLPDPVRFLKNVTRLVRKRLTAATDCETEPSIFFLAPGGPGSHDTKHEPFLYAGGKTLGGSLWFVGPVVGNAHGLAVSPWDDADAFARAKDQLGLADIPAVVFYPTPDLPQLLFYPEGLAADNGTVVLLDATNVTLTDVLETVNIAYEKALKTPSGHTGRKIWGNQSKFEPAKRPEAAIQSYLHFGLQMAYPSCDIRQEESSIEGRLDIEIVEYLPGTDGASVPKAILELKVLPAVTGSGNPVQPSDIEERVREGVRQAYAYRKKRQARESALCCFDMRKTPSGETCFAHVRNLANQLEVQLRVWFLFNEAKESRKATVASVTTSPRNP